MLYSQSPSFLIRYLNALKLIPNTLAAAVLLLFVNFKALVIS